MPACSITLLMTAHNALPYLKEAVDSVLRQDKTACSLLLVDRASSDGSSEWLAQLERERGPDRPEITVVRLPENHGRSAALNHGLQLADTEYVALMDPADIASPDRLATLKAFFADHPDVDLVCSDVTYLDGGGPAAGRGGVPTSHAGLLKRLACSGFPARSSCAFRRDAALRAGGFRPDIGHYRELALWLAMLASGCTTAGIARPLSAVRLYPGPAGRDLSLLLVRAEETRLLMEDLLALPGLCPATRVRARLRGARALFRLKKYKRAMGQLRHIAGEYLRF